MKRLTASLAVTALALTGCGQAGNEQSGPAAEQTTASSSQQGADEAVHSTGDLRRAMEAAGMEPSEVSPENADPGQLLESASVEPEQCRVLLDATQGADLGTDAGLSAKTDSASYFAAANAEGAKLTSVVENARKAGQDCSTMKVTIADETVETNVTVEDVEVDGADDAVSTSADVDFHGQKLAITTITAAKDNTVVAAVISHGGKPETAAKTISSIVSKLG